MPDNGQSTPPRKTNFFATVSAVLWSFLGVRRKKDYQQDAQQLKPVHVIIAGLIGGLVFVLTIVLVVNLVLSSGR